MKRNKKKVKKKVKKCYEMRYANTDLVKLELIGYC